MSGLADRWRQVILSPRIAAFDRQRSAANWSTIWLSLLGLGVFEGLGVAYAIYGPDAAAGYSSLPLGPKAHLPHTPLLPLAAFGGSIVQFFLFSGLLYVSAQLFGGKGDYKTQTYLLVLFWTPLMVLSDVVEFIPVVGAWLALLARLYALTLCAVALASAHYLRLSRAWAALLAIVASGLLLGILSLAALGSHVTQFVK